MATVQGQQVWSRHERILVIMVFIIIMYSNYFIISNIIYIYFYIQISTH